MELISQHAKKIMEDCKTVAKEAGLVIDTETLEYIVTNRDLLELSPKVMIPTLYDFWVHDVQVHQGKGFYKIYPSNPYETVINTRPAISFYNDNNPDWLNVMIFYHVLGHVDFFHNNIFYKRTWEDDFCGKALSDKKMIERIREEQGEKKRWVDYVIEFFRTVDNLVAYYPEMEEQEVSSGLSSRVDFYFGEFLRKKKKGAKFYSDEVARYNKNRRFGENCDNVFFANEEFRSKNPEFEAIFKKHQKQKKKKKPIFDVMQFIMEHSPFIKKDGNEWMKSIGEVVRSTSLYFQPQIRTKTINEGWASYWHQELFMRDKGIGGNEINFAKIDAGVTSVPRVGFNPYAIGLRLLQYIEELADKGKLTRSFQRIKNARERKNYNQRTGEGKKHLFYIRENFSDSMLLNYLTEKEFQDFVNKYKLFVVGKRLDWSNRSGNMVWKYFIKSKKGEDYRKMLKDSLYHPPYITVDKTKSDGGLHLFHHFEGRQLVISHIRHVLAAIDYLWNGPKGGAPIRLTTIQFEIDKRDQEKKLWDPDFKPKYKKKRVVYKREKGKFTSEAKIIESGIGR